VVSQPDRPKGRGKRLARTPVAALADQLGLTVHQWPRLNNDSYATLSALKPDLAVVIAYGKILPRRYLALPRWGCVNLHASLLPAYRGAAPIQWSVINGEREAGVSVMRLDEGMDTGPVALMRSLEVGTQESSGELHDRLSVLAASALTEALTAWRSAPLTFEEQDHTRASHAPMLTKDDGLLDCAQPAVSLANRARGVTPWPGAQLPFAEGRLKVLSCEALTDEALTTLHPKALSMPCGVVVSLEGEGPVLKCAEGGLRLTRVQRPNRSAVSGADFMRGYPLSLGAPLN
jgi:methionyl-tRNA formyltransferase